MMTKILIKPINIFNFNKKGNRKMRKFILAFVLLVTVNILPQTPIDIGRYGTVFNDSVYYAVAGGDSVYQIDLNFEYEWMKIIIIGNANDPVDSLSIQEGTPLYSNLTGYPNGSYAWGSLAALKDSALQDHTVMVNNTVGKSYILWGPALGSYKLYIRNHWATLNTRKVSFAILVKRK